MLPLLSLVLSLLRVDRLIWDGIRYHAIGASAGSFLSVNTSDFWHPCGCGRARATWHQGWGFDDWRYGARASWRISRDSLCAFDIVKGWHLLLPLWVFLIAGFTEKLVLADLGSLGESWFHRRVGQLRTGLSHAFRLQSASVSRAAGNESRSSKRSRLDEDTGHSGA